MTRILAIMTALLLLEGSPNAAENGLGNKPYMGWSSWSLEATKYPGYGGDDPKTWLTAEHVKAQSDALHEKLQKFGYTYINMDSGWNRGFDSYGRPLPDPVKFPEGITGIARYVHRNRQKLGIYYVPGIDDELVRLNPPIYKTPYHIQDIIFKPKRIANGWGGGYKIDFSQPGAQAYINSVAAMFALWGIDFLKLDGVTPGSDHPGPAGLAIDARPDVAAWSAALKKTGRPVWLTISWKIDPDYTDYWRKYANAWRVNSDVETYGPTLTGWQQIRWRFDELRRLVENAGPDKGWNDLDSLDAGNGAMDGLTEDERQSMMTFWAVECAPLYVGDDLTKLDDYGLKLLTNSEVIAIDQAGHPASLLIDGKQQIWRAKNPDGSQTVALFNLDDGDTATITLKWSDLGLDGPIHVRDLWTHSDLGLQGTEFSVTLAPHASRLVIIRQIR